MEWVTGAAILAHAGNGEPSSDESEWADLCAAAVSAALDHRLEGSTYVAPPAPPELVTVALNAGAEAYLRRAAPFGPTSYADLQAAAARTARDYLEAQAPIIARYATFGLA